MKFRIHHHDDPLERLEVVLFHCMQWISIEEWDHFHREVLSISDDENVCLVVPASTVIQPGSNSRDFEILRDYTPKVTGADAARSDQILKRREI